MFCVSEEKIFSFYFKVAFVDFLALGGRRTPKKAPKKLTSKSCLYQHVISFYSLFMWLSGVFCVFFFFIYETMHILGGYCNI